MSARLVRIAILVFLCAAWSVLGQQGPDDYPHKPTVLAYIEAFNSGDESKMAAFFTANLVETSLQQRPMAERLERYRAMHGTLQNLTLRAIAEIEMSPEKQSITAAMRAANGDAVTITFRFDPQPPNKLLGLGVELSGPDEGPPVPAAKAPLTMTEEGLKRELAAYLDEASKRDEFSGVVLVARHGTAIFQQAYGDADKQTKAPNRIDTKFNLGSINKVFTRICIEQLVAAGKVSMDDTIGKFLPGYPNQEAAQKVTVRQLVNMTSGIGDFFGDRYTTTPKENLRTLTDYLPLFADKPLLFAPGTQERYSNGGYVVLGLIIEKVSGESYYDYVKKNLFEPADMADTDYYLIDQKVANRAEGYTRAGSAAGVWANNRDSRPARGSSAGGGYSTAPDLLRFTSALASGKIRSSVPGLGIAGGAPGTNAALEFNPKQDYAIVVLSNYDPPSAERIARQIREWMRSL